MNDKPPLELGADAPWGSTTCAFGLDKPRCDAQATRHFLWLEDLTMSNSCDIHATYIHSRDTSKTPFDEHAFGPNCCMPGAMWHHPYEDEKEGYCFFPAPDDISAAENSQELHIL